MAGWHRPIHKAKSISCPLVEQVSSIQDHNWLSENSDCEVATKFREAIETLFRCAIEVSGGS